MQYVSRYVSPLRYPGGKGGLAPYLADLLRQQTPRPLTYVEPFAGGAGAALRLLHDEQVERVVLNDLDPGVAALWRAIVNNNSSFAELVESCDLTLDEWQRQHSIYRAGKGNDLKLGFATFYLNRTNRSGILNARPIGGLRQTGKWKLDARFNRAELASRIRLLGRYRNRIEVSQLDAVDLLVEHDSASERSFIYVDPPYLQQGADLYLDPLHWEDHVRLAQVLREKHKLWMVTYDADDRVPELLFPTERTARFRLAHTAAVQHVGQEYVIYSDDLNVHGLNGLGSPVAGAEWLRARRSSERRQRQHPRPLRHAPPQFDS